MGIFDELRSSFGDDFFDRPTVRESTHNWCELCTCGHIGRYHAPTVGGGYLVKEPYPKHMGGGRTATITTVFDGCVGAVRTRGTEMITVESMDRDAGTMNERINPTCPCTAFRPVARIDRPNRYFNQRVPIGRNREDPTRHPFMVGLRAFSTHLSKRRAALADPAWPAAELERRFTWLDGARVCGLSKCRETAEVWPVYIDGDAARSELRCPAHR